ncbi:tetratricopeptide repeat protein [Chryseolinea sp. H1M3-3]|uniref:type IX secretion system periplasmic lipoprotein PorW/SprE n=1 Tax=Chryseolinea sp. H1M3-3 TaxID=3034144 RepID=UPI0023EC6501|nr:tetratricopeptide repeat protein [Chryseolinea sp. H1M3-3]
MKGLFKYVYFLLGLFTIGACSSERNTWTSKAYHNATAHYNGYYYAKEEVRKVENTLWESLIDDYNRILRLYPELDTALAKSYDKEIQEAIKMASIAIQRHPNSKWVDDCYILVAKARLYSMDWGNAVQTLKWVNSKSKDPDARHKAIIQLVRTFTEHQEFNNAQAAIDFVEKEELTKTNRKNLLIEKAYFYQEQEDYDRMVRNLTEVAPMLKKKDKPGRIYFIIGQVYQKLGFEAEAFNFYKKCIATNPEYEVDFYARLYLAQVTEISRSKSVNAARKSFRKLLKDNKNKEFKDKIFYEMGVFELKQKNLDEAIANFNKSIREGTNRRIDGEAYLRLGEIYYDTLRKYELSQAYYDSAITSLPTDYEGYAEIKARQEILDEFVKNLNTIKWQDSLLVLAGLDSITIRTKIDSAFQAKKALADAKEGKKKRRRSNRIDITSNANSVFDTGGDDGNEETTDWYFGNLSAMSLGQSEFKRIWGNIPLEDNWRRSLRSTANQPANQNAADAPAEAQAVAAEEAAAPVDPVAAEYERIDKQIPRTEEQKKAALKQIEDAYYNLGDIYYFKLLEKDNAVITYNKLLDRFPETEYEPEILYKLYLFFKETDAAKSEVYASRLKAEHPNSTFTKILLNPDFLKESSQAVERQKTLYKKAYEEFEAEAYDSSLQTIEEAYAIGENSFTPSLDLLKILIAGETEDINKYQYLLTEFINAHNDDELGAYAKKLLETSQNFQKNQELNKGIQYIRSLEEPHYFLIVYKTEENMSLAASTALSKFNEDNFKDLKLKTSNLVLNDMYTLTLVADLPGITTALDYIKTFNEKLSTLTEFRNHKFHNFVITKDNFDIFYRTKGLDEYLKFFEKNYPAEIQ